MRLILPKRPHRFGKTRSEHEYNIRRDWGCKTLEDDQLDRCKFMEKMAGKKNFFDQSEIHTVKSKEPNSIEKRQIEAQKTMKRIPQDALVVDKRSKRR